MIGKTPIVKLDLLRDSSINFYFKLEGMNPTGSIKDRAAFSIIKHKIETGELKSGQRLLDASSGSFACSIAYIGKILGYPVTVVTGTKMTKDKLNFVRYFEAKNITFGRFTIDGNRYCSDTLCKTDPEKYCFLDQLHNWKNPETHYTTTGPEILSEIPDISAVAMSLGSGGSFNGVSRYIRNKKTDTKLISVTAASNTKIPGVGSFIDGDYITPFIDDIEKKNLSDYTAVVSMEDAVKRTYELKEKGLYVGFQTGCVCQGMLEAIKELNIKGNVLVLSGDSGWKNTDKLYT